MVGLGWLQLQLQRDSREIKANRHIPDWYEHAFLLSNCSYYSICNPFKYLKVRVHPIFQCSYHYSCPVHEISWINTNLPPDGGKTCEGPLKQIRACNIGVCEKLAPPQDCVLDEWTDWSSCSTKCAGGVKTRSRHVVTYPKNGGKAYMNNEFYDLELHIMIAILIGIAVSSRRDSRSNQYQLNAALLIMKKSSRCDASMKEITGCNPEPCQEPVDCVWNEWDKWGMCDKKCGGGEQYRFRHVKTMAAHRIRINFLIRTSLSALK